MHVEHHSLSKDFPEKLAQLLKLSQEDPTFARKAENYEALSQRIRSLEDDATDSAALESLKQEHSILKDDIARDLKRASGSCCGGCGG
ncbi:MAG: YdcH family protein [Pseudomonas sp.]